MTGPFTFKVCYTQIQQQKQRIENEPPCLNTSGVATLLWKRSIRRGRLNAFYSPKVNAKHQPSLLYCKRLNANISLPRRSRAPALTSSAMELFTRAASQLSKREHMPR